MKARVFILSLSISFGFIACDSDEDTTAPIIEHVHGSEEVAVGDDFEVDADFSDNEELGQAKFDIHDIFDGHDHGKIASSWSETRTVELSGQDAEAEETFTVPANATAGPYHVVVQCTDAAGNSAEFKEFDFWVTSDEAPQYAVTSPMDDADYSFGDVIQIAGSVNDISGIEEVFIRIYEEGDHDHDHGDEEGDEHGEPLYEEEVEAGGATSFDLVNLTPITLDSSMFDEDHVDIIIEISAIDNDGHISRHELHGHID